MTLSTRCSNSASGRKIIFVFLREAKFKQPVYAVRFFVAKFIYLPFPRCPSFDGLLFHFIRKHSFLNGRKHLVDVFAGDNHNRDKDLFFYLFSLEMLKQSFARANSH